MRAADGAKPPLPLEENYRRWLRSMRDRIDSELAGEERTAEWLKKTLPRLEEDYKRLHRKRVDEKVAPGDPTRRRDVRGVEAADAQGFRAVPRPSSSTHSVKCDASAQDTLLKLCSCQQNGQHLAFRGAFGTDYPGNRVVDVKNPSLSWMLGFIFVAKAVQIPLVLMALEEAFEVFCNKGVSGSWSDELLVTFCDNILKKGFSEKVASCLILYWDLVQCSSAVLRSLNLEAAAFFTVRQTRSSNKESLAIALKGSRDCAKAAKLARIRSSAAAMESSIRTAYSVHAGAAQPAGVSAGPAFPSGVVEERLQKLEPVAQQRISSPAWRGTSPSWAARWAPDQDLGAAGFVVSDHGSGQRA
ncbi:hypothetical protein ACQ4PT_010774 [Festuca glaucescens]